MTTGNKRRLLVLDDEQEVCITICAIAASAGFETKSSTTAGDFFDILNQWHPSHLIVDLQMPDVDGVETLKTLAQRGCSATVIVTTGLGSRVLEAAARAAAENNLHVVGTLAKPFTPNRLRTLLSKHTEEQSLPAQSAHTRAARVDAEELRKALREGHFRPYFQPKIACASGEVVGFECLARWPHPELGMIMPDTFIPLAEHCGLITEVTKAIFTRALDWFTTELCNENIRLALNLSATMLEDAGFSQWLMDQCREFNVKPSQLILELTESSSMNNPIAMLEFLTQFRIKGFSLSIDDFGVGYSSLIQLARLPFSEMKIDKMFVISAPISEESQKIATAIVGLANALGLEVTAEGVEDQWTLNFLADIGCNFAQGYYIARPMDGETSVDWLSAKLAY